MRNGRQTVAKIEDLRPVQEDRFARQMDLVFQAHPYYSAQFKKAGLTRADIKGLDDLHKIPLTQKEDYIGQPDSFRLQMDQVPGVAQEERILWDIVYTAGSTSNPARFFDTCYDHYARISQLKRTAEIAGITSKDTVINLFPLTAMPHQGFLSVLWGTQAVGARMVSSFGGSFDAGFDLVRRSSEALEMIVNNRVTVLWGIGFFLRRMIMQAQETNIDLSSVKLVLPMGEGSPAGMREDIRRRLVGLGARDVRVLNGYGFTEMQGPNMECAELKGFHLAKPGRYFFELLDPKSLEPAAEGREGLVVMTHLDRRGTCLLRYVVGDICHLTEQPCPVCGAWEPRFDTIPYRTGNIIKVKGTLINISSLFEVLGQLEEIDEYEIIVTQTDKNDPYSEDLLIIRIACEDDRTRGLARKVTEVVHRTQEVTPRVEFVPLDYYKDALKNYKFKRFKDERQRLR